MVCGPEAICTASSDHDLDRRDPGHGQGGTLRGAGGGPHEKVLYISGTSQMPIDSFNKNLW
jgi:hypothetical protein